MVKVHVLYCTVVTTHDVKSNRVNHAITIGVMDSHRVREELEARSESWCLLSCSLETSHEFFVKSVPYDYNVV